MNGRMMTFILIYKLLIIGKINNFIKYNNPVSL